MEEEEFFIFNGDTFFNIRLSALAAKHRSQAADLSIALRRMANFDRYGVVRTDAQNRIVSFEEKKFYSEGNINGGIYLLNRKLMKEISLPSKFSFEKELMENYFSKRNFFGYPFDNFFIDIGIPEDYARAQSELPAVINEDFRHAAYKEWPAVDPSWTLFLDRDGVINKKIDGDYVRNLSQFEWLPGARESIVRLSALFGRTIVVSNQQGVGKGLMTRNAVEEIHAWLGEEIRMQGGKIDRFYFAPQLKSENSPMRKPGAGMALKAKEDFPEINFSKSLMVGDSMSDMEFGRKSGMRTVFISHGKKTGNDPLIDFVVAGLPELVSRIQ
jgi:D-glycero-alpha-D-manno-heptose 1-phosphate guanylyltransferase